MPRTAKAIGRKTGIGFSGMVEASQERAAEYISATSNDVRNNERNNINKEIRNDGKSEGDKKLELSQVEITPTTLTQTHDMGYTENSPIKWAYDRGEMPTRHRDLYEALKATLREQIGDDAQSGDIQLENALKKANMKRYSATQIMRHLQNFGYIQYEGKYRRTWIKILK